MSSKISKTGEGKKGTVKEVGKVPKETSQVGKQLYQQKDVRKTGPASKPSLTREAVSALTKEQKQSIVDMKDK